jgi:hypothetical protein
MVQWTDVTWSVTDTTYVTRLFGTSTNWKGKWRLGGRAARYCRKLEEESSRTIYYYEY